MRAVEIRRFGVSDAWAYRGIRLAALEQSPEAFGSTYDIEVARPIAAFEERLATSTVFGAYVEGKLVGIAGFKQQGGEKDAHKGFVWGMYVRPEARRRGVGAALVEAILRFARDRVEQLTLTVVRGNDPAIEIYKKAGFVVYGVEPRALKTYRDYFDEVLMVCFLS